MGLLSIILRDFNEWIDKIALTRLFNRSHGINIPMGTERYDLNETFYIKNSSPDKDYIIILTEMDADNTID